MGSGSAWVVIESARELPLHAYRYLSLTHLLKLGVAVIPGSAFAMAPGRRMVRLSCALESLADVETALERIDRAMGEWVRR